MCLVTKYIKTNPLNGMKYNQRKTKTQVINYRYGYEISFCMLNKLETKVINYIFSANLIANNNRFDL